MRSKEVATTLSYFIVLVLVFPIAQVIFTQMGIVLFGQELFDAQPWLRTIFSHAIILFLLFFYLKATLESLHTWGFEWNTKYLGLSTGIGVVSAVVLYLIDIQEGFFEVFSVPADPTLLVAVGFLFAWAVLAPFTEEILFRGLIQTSLIKKFGGFWMPIAVTVGMEIILHAGIIGSFSGWPMLSYVGVFSLAASWVYAKTRSLAGPILIHALGNAGELLIYWILL